MSRGGCSIPAQFRSRIPSSYEFCYNEIDVSKIRHTDLAVPFSSCLHAAEVSIKLATVCPVSGKIAGA
eukprot:gene25849-biopygen9388